MGREEQLRRHWADKAKYQPRRVAWMRWCISRPQRKPALLTPEFQVSHLEMSASQLWFTIRKVLALEYMGYILGESLGCV